MKKRKRKTRMIVLIPDDLEKALREHHIKTGVPMAETVRRALMLYLKTQ